ncbi:MAG: phenylalanyl-tRNA synthetase subunit beta [Adhaeribacter sp.]|nr:phenylalanyl-tRNA synthetase subunit beta [Adhaeribacter sp.]
MLISYDWLKQLIPLNKPAAEIAALLTDSGLEVEGLYPFERIKGSLQGIVIGEVLTCEKHPDADKLKVTTVDIGEDQPKNIVCGAANVTAGQKVVVATESAVLYPFSGESFQIKKSKIRGAVSEGMICAEDEIGLGASHAGIMVLDTELPNGTPAAEYFGLGSDIIFEIGLTPNRADAASHYGVARELQALLPIRCQLPDVTGFKVSNNTRPMAIEIADPEGCPRYAGLTITGVTVGDSPEWLRDRLRSIGLSPINNVVDVTNYVLHELGQPLHAFDANKITGNKIIVKRAEEGTSFVTLDGVERKLRSTDLMICNTAEPMVIAGVFGGKNSGVSADTTTIFLESAYFIPAGIRRSSQTHGIKTDSSFRFERGTDPEMVPYALKRAALLIQEVAGGEVSSEINDVYPQPVAPFQIKISLNRVQRLIGQYIDKERIKTILADLQIRISEETETHLTVLVPPHKVDVTREADVIEEILRIYGYNNIVLHENISASYLAKFPHPNPEELKHNIFNLLSGSGFSEIITNSLSDSAYYETPENPDAELVRILNYNSQDLDVLRKTLVFSGLEVLRRNINRRQKDLKLYELGKVYRKADEKYKEGQKLALFLTGNGTAETWLQKSDKATFHYLAGVVQQVLTKLARPDYSLQALQHPYLSDGVAYLKNDTVVAELGLLDERICKKLDIKEPVWYAELNWDYLIRNYKNQLVFRELAKFPEVRRDLSLVIDQLITFEEIKTIARRTERKLLQDINVFDVYQGDKIETGKKAYAISFTLLDPSQTLTDKVIDATMNRLMQQFEKQLGALIRK